jgi:hypothetical protein
MEGFSVTLSQSPFYSRIQMNFLDNFLECRCFGDMKSIVGAASRIATM